MRRTERSSEWPLSSGSWLAVCALLVGPFAQPAHAQVAPPPASVASAPASVPAAAGAPVPRVRIVSVRAVGWKGHDAQVDLVLRVQNPGAWKLALNDIRFRCSFNGTSTAAGRSTGELDLPAHGQADVPVRVDIDGQALLAVLAALPPDDSVRYRLDGDAEIGHTLLRVPFHQQGTVVLQ